LPPLFFANFLDLRKKVVLQTLPHLFPRPGVRGGGEKKLISSRAMAKMGDIDKK
jgi:hypothetical protein